MSDATNQSPNAILPRRPKYVRMMTMATMFVFVLVAMLVRMTATTTTSIRFWKLLPSLLLSSSPPPPPLRSHVASKSSSSSAYIHSPKSHHLCYHLNESQENKNTNQCFLFPKLNDTTITAPTTSGSSHHHRQVQDTYELGTLSSVGDPNGIRHYYCDVGTTGHLYQ